MVFSGNRIKELLSGEEMICDKCKKGVLTPKFASIPLSIQNEFICNKCGDTLYIHRQTRNKPQCLARTE